MKNNVMDSIRNNSKYDCKGEVIFKTSLQYVLDYGKEKLNDNDMMFEWLEAIDRKHDEAEAEHKNLWIGREFEKALLECAIEIAAVDTVDIIKYIQKNWLFYDYDEIDYNRAIELLVNTVNYALQDRETDVAKEDLDYIGFEDEELDALGFEDIFNVEWED